MQAASPATPVAQLRELDLQMSIAVAHFVSDLHAGRIAPRELGHDLDVPHATLDARVAVAALAGSRDTGTLLDDFEPGFHHYDLLKQALARYRPLAADPSLTQLPALPSRTVRPGERYAGAPALRRLLQALADLPTAPTAASTALPDESLDATLVEGLKKFQDRHGTNIDGALGPATFRLLTTPLTQRVRQIEYSLERARWLPPRLAAPPILVNIPQFRLFAFSGTTDYENTLLQMRVVVGKVYPRNNTPVFAADMRYLVLRPYWDVPRTILLNEFMPRISANPAWIANNQFEIVAGEGDDGRVMSATPENIAALQAGSLRLRQKPGGSNALGIAKLMFPNRHNVYLHGTTAQGLFAEARRAFSHGCVRLEDPLQLVEFVLRNEQGWDRAAIDAAVQAGKPRRINLTTPVRVFIMYATAIATEAGEVLFFEDIYGHDARLASALARHARALR
jgi:murein L,D-transpeptidase YcbB/YkuD